MKSNRKGKTRSIVAVALALALFSTTLTGQSAVRAKAAGSTKASTVKIYSSHIGKTSKYGYTPLLSDLPEKYTKASASSKYLQENNVTVPSKYDAREEGVMTSVKDQGAMEICWSFASVGISEANVLKKGLASDPSALDLSEYHLVWSSFNQIVDPLGLKAEDTSHISAASVAANDVYQQGSIYLMPIATLASWRGLADESIAPLTELTQKIADGTPATVDDSAIYQDSYHLQNAEMVLMTDDNINRIKQWIMDKGAAGTAIHAPANDEDLVYTDTNNYDFTALYCDDKDLRQNHAVMLVGWDDDYAVENFNEAHRPKNKGAWLIRNSWGENHNDGGYFWLSYEDALLNTENVNGDQASGQAVFYEVEKADDYENNYQYDSGLPVVSINGVSEISNVFTMQGDEKLQAVSFFSECSDLNYEISIYKLTDKTKPTSGKQVGKTLTGYFPDSGYYTIDLTDSGIDDIPMKKGTTFSVVLKLTNSKGEALPYNCEASCDELGELVVGLEGSVSAEAGESFLYNEDGWNDVTDYDVDNDLLSRNWTIKAFTSKASAAEIAAAEADNSSNSTKNSVIVKKLKFSPSTKKLKAGKSLKLKKYLKITKKKSGSVKISYSFAKKKYKKYATLSSSGVIKAKKKGKGKTVVVYAKAKDGSGKKAKMKLKIR